MHNLNYKLFVRFPQRLLLKKFIVNTLGVMVFNTQKNVCNTQKLLPELSFLEIFLIRKAFF
jgi:hypothetical protein